MRVAHAPLRLFFALWPDEAVRAAVLAVRREAWVQALPHGVPAANLHLTLAFLGSLGAGQRACVEATVDRWMSGRGAVPGDRLAPTGFTLRLDQMGYWPRPQVLWLGPRETPPALSALVRGLRGILIPCGYRGDASPFRAHVTLARKVAPPAGADADVGTGVGAGSGLTGAPAPVLWPVRDFVLLASHRVPSGVRYAVVARWPLSAPL